MCESELDRLYEEEMLTILCVHGRLSLHPHVLTDVCAGLQARQPALPSRFRKYSPHLNTQTGSSFPDRALCVSTAASPTPIPDRKYCFELSTQRAPELQPRAWAPGARRSQVAQTSRLPCVCPASLRPAALPLGSVHNDRRGHGASRRPQFLRELTEGPPQSLDPPPPACPRQGPTLREHHLRHAERGGSPSGPTCQGPTPGEAWA